MNTEYPSDSLSSSDSDSVAAAAKQANEQEKLKYTSNSNLNHHQTITDPPPNQTAPPENDLTNFNQIAHSTTRVSCLFWDAEGCKKVEMTLNDLGRVLIDRVQRSVPPGSEYALASTFFAVIVAIVPLLLRLYTLCQPVILNAVTCNQPFRELGSSIIAFNMTTASNGLFSSQTWESLLIFNGILQRFWLSLVFFLLLCVAENTFKQRVSYAKHFTYLTSAHRARRCDLPHFRLNKVRNIKTWLTLRAYIKRLGPQRPVDTIVSFSFVLSVMLLTLMTCLVCYVKLF